MKGRFLEDIVKEDVNPKVNINKNLGNTIRDYLDSPLIKHPVTVSTAAFFISNYINPENPELSLAASYGLYTTLGLVKEYILETTKSRSKDISSWILNNPKIVALISTISFGIITHYSESNMKDVYQNGVPYLTVGHAVQAGIGSEAIIRGIKNLKRIKKSIKTLATNWKEKAYNILWEHPIAVSSLAFLYWFNNTYSLRTQHKINHSIAGFLRGNILEDIVNNPGPMLSMAARTGANTSLTIGTYLVVGSVLHSHSLRETYYKISKTYNNLRNNKEKVIEYQEKIVKLPNSVERTIENLVELGNIYYENDDRDNAFKYYRRAIRLFSKKSDRISYSDYFRKTFRLDKLNRLITKLRNRNKHDEESQINKVFIGLLNKDISAADEMKLAVEINPENPNLVYMYGKVLDILGYKQSAVVQKFKAIDLAMKDNDGLNIVTGSKYPIIRFNNQVLQEEAIAKCEPIENLEAELRTTERVREITSETDEYDVPIPIGIKEIKGRQCYIMELVSGDLLSDRIQYGKVKVEDFCAVADFMGLIHAKLKPDKLEERSYIDTIRSRLNSVGIEKYLVSSVCFNLSQLDDSLIKIAKVYNKDAHPRNWKIDEFGGIIALDLEEGRVVPLTFDTTNLLDQYKCLGDEQRDYVAYQHFFSYTRNLDSKLNFNLDEYKIAYLNSSIIRAFEIYTQVRDDNKEIMTASIENAQRSINRIKNNFSDYYNLKNKSYKRLYNALEELKKFRCWMNST